jgi:AP-4 complex subunit epsilon-1
LELIRRPKFDNTCTQTLHLLGEVDQGIVNEYYVRAISAATRTPQPFRDLNEKTRRLLGVLEVLFENGELYAKQVESLLAQVESSAGGNGILDSAIDCVLTHIRSRKRFYPGFIA